jgi:hypothetical protein
MSFTQRVGVIVAAAALVCPKAYAPIYGTYPGLHSLIKQAQVIAAITILDKLSKDDMGGSARYKIEFERVFKGTAPDKQSVAYLRYLDIIPEADLLRTPPPEPRKPTHYFAPTEFMTGDSFPTSSRWIAFLTKPRPGIDAAYENVNCSGSTFPLSPLTDVDALKVDSLPDALIRCFREYVDYKRTVLKQMEQQLDAFIHQRDE